MLFRKNVGTTKQVEIFFDQSPQRPFEELGLVQVMAHGSSADEDVTMKALIEEAKKAGCDAVVKTRFTPGATVSHVIGVCVMWRDDLKQQ